ncbi:11189_t:CDS:1, partial [Funneliformis geosporum]
MRLQQKAGTHRLTKRKRPMLLPSHSTMPLQITPDQPYHETARNLGTQGLTKDKHATPPPM